MKKKNKTISCFFEKINNYYNPLARSRKMIKKRNEGHLGAPVG